MELEIIEGSAVNERLFIDEVNEFLNDSFHKIEGYTLNVVGGGADAEYTMSITYEIEEQKETDVKTKLYIIWNRIVNERMFKEEVKDFKTHRTVKKEHFFTTGTGEDKIYTMFIFYKEKDWYIDTIAELAEEKEPAVKLVKLDESADYFALEPYFRKLGYRVVEAKEGETYDYNYTQVYAMDVKVWAYKIGLVPIAFITNKKMLSACVKQSCGENWKLFTHIVIVFECNKSVMIYNNLQKHLEV